MVTLPPQVFRNNGYYAARVGKIYHYSNPGGIGTSGLDDPASWQEVVNPSGRDVTLMQQAVNYTPSHTGFGSSMAYLSDPTGKDEEYTDGKVATEVIRLLERHQHEPFFLGAGFYKPHCPYIVPKAYFDLYRLEDIQVPQVPAEFAKSVPAPALTLDAAVARLWGDERALPRNQAGLLCGDFIRGRANRAGARRPRSPRPAREYDRRLLERPRLSAISASRGCGSKRGCFERAARVPLIVSPPAWAAAGRVSSRLVEHVDIYPTVTDLAGLAAPDTLAGVSLRPLLENPDATWNRPAYTQVERKRIPEAGASGPNVGGTPSGTGVGAGWNFTITTTTRRKP